MSNIDKTFAKFFPKVLKGNSVFATIIYILSIPIREFKSYMDKELNTDI